MNVSASNSASANGSSSALASHERIALAEPARATRRAPSASISGLWSTPTTVQPVLPHELDRDRARAGRDVEHRSPGAGLDPRDEEPPPARVLPEREQRGVAVVRRAERREELESELVPLSTIPAA